LFHPTSAPRVLVFRAFPARPAVAPLGARCSPAVGLARVLRPSPLQRSAHPDRRPRRADILGDCPATLSEARDISDDFPATSHRNGVTSGRKPPTERESRALPQAPLDSASGPSETHRSRRRAPAPEHCSDRASVPRSPLLGVEQGRCSPDLPPLRGLPTRPSGRSPPLSRFRSTQSPAPKNELPSVARRPRVSNQSSLATTPKSRRSPHGVSDLVRLRSTLHTTPANRNGVSSPNAPKDAWTADRMSQTVNAALEPKLPELPSHSATGTGVGPEPHAFLLH
jgi:hypothetical protein